MVSQHPSHRYDSNQKDFSCDSLDGSLQPKCSGEVSLPLLQSFDPAYAPAPAPLYR